MLDFPIYWYRTKRPASRAAFRRVDSKALRGANPVIDHRSDVRSTNSEPGVILSIHGNSSELVTCHAHGPAFGDLIIPLYDFASRLGDVGRKGEEKVLGDALLNRHSGALSASGRRDWL